MEQKHDYAALLFGEAMMRLSPFGAERIVQGGQFVKYAGGAELNVASGIARLGLRTGLISKLPDNDPGRFIRNQIRSYGVSDDYVVDDESTAARLGLYYYEDGGYPRRPAVTYDRAASSFTTITSKDIDPSAFKKAALFHTSGISLALGANARATAIALIKGFKQQGALVSFDVNYRAKLWSEAEAKETITALLPYVDILFVSEETSRRMMAMTGTMEEIQRAYATQYDISYVASTQRTVISPRRHNFTSLLYAAKENRFYTEDAYTDIEVCDRIGSGDAYVSGVLYALLRGMGGSDMVAWGNATSAVKNTLPGDLLTTSAKEVAGIITQHRNGGGSEMDR